MKPSDENPSILNQEDSKGQVFVKFVFLALGGSFFLRCFRRVSAGLQGTWEALSGASQRGLSGFRGVILRCFREFGKLFEGLWGDGPSENGLRPFSDSAVFMK
jgi:hypothetical protein